MILDETVTVKINATTVGHYLNLGYTLPTHVDAKGRVKTFKRGVTTLEVKVADLFPKSNVQVRARCEECKTERLVAYHSYGPLCWRCNLEQQKLEKHPRYIPVDGAKSDKERRFALFLMRKFGLTLERYYALLEAQSYKCGICKKPQQEDGRRFCVDHDHDTGHVRGILCQSCNTAIGLLQDDPKVISSAAKYLEYKNG